MLKLKFNFLSQQLRVTFAFVLRLLFVFQNSIKREVSD
jgi:hypothetical protein